VSNAILVVNSGSTSLKFAAYSAAINAPLNAAFRGEVRGLQGNPRFIVSESAGEPVASYKWDSGKTVSHRIALQFVLSWIQSNMGLKIGAAGHRVVQGGARFRAPVRIDPEVVDYLDSLAIVEPSHQPYNVEGVRTLDMELPGILQVACFDTSFHRTMPEVAQTYALVKELRDAGVRHWGYHGISYDYISREIRKFAPDARRVIAAHLGGGASMCAMFDGCSIETSTGFGGLSGLPMATRSGDVPIEALFYVLRKGIVDAVGLEKMLYHQSGLLGLSEISSDMRELLLSEDPRAIGAIDNFVYSMTRYAGAYVSVLGGLDAFVFTAGIGEHSPEIRTALCKKLHWLGVKLDENANLSNQLRISSRESSVSVWVIPTNEELIIAEYTRALTMR